MNSQSVTDFRCWRHSHSRVRVKWSANPSPNSSPASVGNGYTDLSNGILPGTLEAATRKMKESPIAGELFGEGFADHF
ncbi:MAG: hypothetical protein ACKO3B_03120, partial [Bacteroidota bacterium]